MKHLYLLLLLFSFVSFGQGTLDYTLQIIDTKGKPMVNTTISLVETSSLERLVFKTDASGNARFMLDHGKEWAVTIKEMRNCRYLKVGRGNGSGSGLITYDLEFYKRQRRPMVDRTKLDLEIVPINKSIPSFPDENHSVIELNLRKDKRDRLTDYPVQLTCYALNKTFEGKSDKAGKARFYVPVGHDYEIDIDGIETFSWIDIGSRPSMYSQTVTYEPTNIKESEINGFVIQQLPNTIEPTSARGRVSIKVNNAPNENIYLSMLKSNKVFKAKTNSEGEAQFLLPIKRKYMIHFDFQKDVDVIDFSRVQGFAYKEMTLNYFPDPKLQYPERYIPTNESLMLYEFSDFVDKQYPESEKDLDFDLKWGNKYNKNSKEAILEIGLKTRKNVKNLGPPINVCFVLDVSGSMGGYDRIEILKSSLSQFVEKLRQNDIVSIVLFNSSAHVAIPPTKVGNRAMMKDIIAVIEAGGGTNIHSGLQLGYEQVSSKLIQSGTNRIVLLTDGYGSTPVDEITAGAKAIKSKGVDISAVGVGEGYDHALLTQLATSNGGLLHIADNAEKIERAFSKELSSMLYPIAKVATLEVMYGNEIIFRQLIGHEDLSQSDNKATVKIDNIYPGLNKMMLAKFDLINATKELEKQPVRVKLSYTNISTGKAEIIEKSLPLEWTDATGELDMLLDLQQKKMYAVAIVNQSLKLMAEAFTNGNNAAAESAIKDGHRQMKNLFPSATDEDISALFSELEQYMNAFVNIRKKGAIPK